MPRSDDNRNRPNSGAGDEPVDFGEFVSSNVQRTSDLLKGEGGSAQNPSAPPPRPGGDRTVDRAKDGSYWRRKAAGAGVPIEEELEGELPPPQQPRGRRNRYLPPADGEVDQFHDENEFSDDGGGIGGFFSDFFSGDGDDGNRNRIMAAIVALIILLLIIFGLTQLFSGDDDDSTGDGDATPIPTQVIAPPSTPEEDPTDLTGDPEQTEEPEIPRGGDNIRGEGEDPDPPPEAVATQTATVELTSEIARACTGFCLVRMEGPNQQAALDEAGARVSWEDGDISWIVTTPEQAEILQRTHTLTLIENEPRTYNLYIVKAAEDHNQRDVVTPHGTVIDETGRYYLVRWNSVPAVVKPVTDWGYAVWKIAPAQPEVIAELGTNGPASGTNGWALMGEVQPANVERIVTDLSHVGELDNSGLGTRYYTYPGNQIAADYLYQELESYGLDVWFEDFIMWDGYLLVNVVAEIPGNDDSEIYGMMAHFDTINTDNPRVAPGADDNASGLAVTLEVARILAGYELEHPVRIALVNAEEVGIIGSAAWARGSINSGENVVGVYNIDSVGSVRNRPYIITNSDANSSWMQSHLTSINSKYELHETLDHKQTDVIVADDNFVRAEGVPAIMVARELYGATEIHHTINDTTANVSMGGIVDTTYIILLAMWELVL